ncbi:MAG TPA: hypothetical protein P5079_04805 [Elusimicrobiota bacterium]|nr:hypothetical protein [Elusimicrobiota bacterium]
MKPILRKLWIRLSRDASGHSSPAAIAALLIVSISLPMVVKMVDNESKWAVKQKKTTTAFHLAEAGVDRAVWKLTEIEQNWLDAKEGTPIPGYDDDMEYTDVQGGEYKILISSGPTLGQVTIRALGRDSTQKEVRGIQAVYTRNVVDAALSVEGGLQYKPNLHVHWGPVVNYTSISQSPGDYYPRKFSKGQIVGRDTVNDSVNTDGLEYWAFDTSLGTPPQVDLDYYKEQAKNSVIPLEPSGGGRIEKNIGGNVLAVASPTGSGYFLASMNGNSGLRFEKTGGSSFYDFRNSTSVIYIDNDTGAPIVTDLQNGGCFLRVEGLILAGDNHNMDCNAQEGVLGATIPVHAQKEYKHSSAESYWNTNFSSVGEGNCCYALTKLAVHGFVYVGGNIANAGSNTEILGALDVKGNVNVNTLKVYYDEDIAEQVHLTGGTPRRLSWKEVNETW